MCPNVCGVSVCSRAPHGVGVFCRRCLRVVDVVVMGECSLTHTRSREQGSACIKRANKRSFPHQQPTADTTSRQESNVRPEGAWVVGVVEPAGCSLITWRTRGQLWRYWGDQFTWHLTLYGSVIRHFIIYKFPPSSQSAPVSLLVSILSIFLPFFPYFCFLFTSHFSPTVCAPLYIYFILSPSSSLMSPTLTLSSSFLCDPAVINRRLVGRWSVRKGRCNARSQLLQVFPGRPRRAALCAAACQPYKQNIQTTNTL